MDKSKVIFVDINTQNDFLELHGSQYIPQSVCIRRNLARLVNLATNHKLPIISIVDTHISNDPEFSTFKPHCIANTWGWQKIPETTYKDFQYIDYKEANNLNLKPNRFILKKPRNSAFSNLNLIDIIKLLKRDTFILFGVPTDSCIRELAIELTSKHHFTVYLVEDAIKGINESHSAAAIQEMVDAGVQLVKTGKILVELK